MLSIIGSVLGIIAPLLIRGIAWILDWVQTKDQTKKDFYRFFASWEADRGSIVGLHASGRDQLVAIQKEIEEENKIKNQPVT